MAGYPFKSNKLSKGIFSILRTKTPAKFIVTDPKSTQRDYTDQETQEHHQSWKLWLGFLYVSLISLSLFIPGYDDSSLMLFIMSSKTIIGLFSQVAQIKLTLNRTVYRYSS